MTIRTACASAALILGLATQSLARPITVDVPVEVVPSRSIAIQWVKVQTDTGRTVVSGIIGHKGLRRMGGGDLHVAAFSHGVQLACRSAVWRRYGPVKRAAWRFATSLPVNTSEIDAIRITHVERGSEEPSAVAQPGSPCEPFQADGLDRSKKP